MDTFLGNNSKNNSKTNLAQLSNFNSASPNINSAFTNSGFGNAGINVQGTDLPKNLKITSWILFIVSIIFSILLI